jgi:hypothetical protein
VDLEGEFLATLQPDDNLDVEDPVLGCIITVVEAQLWHLFLFKKRFYYEQMCTYIIVSCILFVLSTKGTGNGPEAYREPVPSLKHALKELK